MRRITVRFTVRVLFWPDLILAGLDHVLLTTPSHNARAPRIWNSLKNYRLRMLTFMVTLKPQSNGPSYGDWYTGRWWVRCYIWYSQEGRGRVAAPPSPLIAVPNVTARLSTASVPTWYHSTWYYNCLCARKGSGGCSSRQAASLASVNTMTSTSIGVSAAVRW